MAQPPPYKVSELLKGGGANRDRTDHLYNAIVALSQLSYSPVSTACEVSSHPPWCQWTGTLVGSFFPIV